MGTGVKSAGT